MTKKSFVFRLFAASFFAAYFCVLLTPQSVVKSAKAAAPVVASAQAECVMEINSRRVLYEEHGDIRLPMASTTKILTCATVLELCEDVNEEITIPAEAAGVEGSSVYLKEGEKYTVEDLLYGLMLRSGNDCAAALAIHCSGSIAAFSAEMNGVAQKAGALSCNFENPHGLPCKEHYTTARDLSLITAYAMQKPTFCKIVSTQYYDKYHWKNKNKMLSLYEGGIGVKTGYTKEAGRCLVSAAKRGEMTLVCVVLNCPTTYERSTQLLDDAFESYEYVKLLGKDDILTVDGTDKKGVCGRDYYYPLLQEEKDLTNISTKALASGKGKEKSQEIVGQFEIYLSKRLLFSGNLYKL